MIHTFLGFAKVAAIFVKSTRYHRICETAGESWESVLEVTENNKMLNDAGEANQALNTADIEKMRAEGKSGDEIVAALTENSATFASKTQYSQVPCNIPSRSYNPYFYAKLN